MSNIFGKHLRVTIKTNNISSPLWVITCFSCVLSISQYGNLKVSIQKILRKFHMASKNVLALLHHLLVFPKNRKAEFCKYSDFGD